MNVIDHDGCNLLFVEKPKIGGYPTMPYNMYSKQGSDHDKGVITMGWPYYNN